MSHSFTQRIRPAPTHQRVSREENPNHHQSVQTSPGGETIHGSPRLLRYPGLSDQEVLDRVESIINSTASHAPASTLAPLNSIPDTMSPHPSHLYNGPVVIPRHLRSRSGNYRSSPPAGQDTGVTHTPTSGADHSSLPAGRDASVTHTSTSAGPDNSSRSTAWDNPVAYAIENRLTYPSYRPQSAPDNSMSERALAGGRSDYPSRPANSENPLAYASNNESQYPHNATQSVSENRRSHDTNRAHQGVPDDRVSRRTSYTPPDVPDNRTPHHTNPQGQYSAVEPSSSYSVAQRWDSSTRASAYQEPYRPYLNNGPQYSGQYQEPIQDGRPMPAGYDAPPHHSFRDGRGYSQQPPPPTYRHHSYQDSRGYSQQQPPPATRHHSYNDERGYPQQQHPPAPSHHPYQDSRGYPQQQPPHPPHYPYHDGRGYPQDQPPAAQPPLRQSAPRQRTAIACKYCRRRKIRCSGFTADGSGGQCTNCARFKQECVFTPVSSAQAFVPLIALTEALQHGTNSHPGVYGAHGQRLPNDPANQNPTEPYQGYHPQQGAPGPPMAYNHQQMPQQVAQYAPQHVQQPIHPTYLPPMNRSPHDRDTLPSPTGSLPQQTPPTHLPPLSNRSPYDQGATLPSPTGSLDSQKRKREADERHFARAAPSAPGQFSGYNRESNAPYRIPSLQEQYQYHSSVPSPPTRQYGYQQGENVTPRLPALQNGQQYRSSIPSPPSNQQYGHQQEENALAYRPMEDGRQSTQWASVNSNEAPRNDPSPNGSSTSFHSQNPSGNHQPSQVSPYRAESSQFPLASPARTNSGGGNRDQVARETERPNQMNIANIVERDDNDVDRDMLRRLGSNRS
ncbi:putative c6 transcription protein [Botrytis fragariae]|uniref:Putative c6 transcription protein n=1 Tax=Botrytis fragariae TaxID=1964551 RepID=A0A8H6B064_9HELO|nr:putative c6 transcription protein [Botrytis fragariae]KAF5876998.1 putative c6 transcription protein [Botrytis fragariae]